MKNIALILIFSISLYAQSPSKNSALNSISPSSNDKEGNMQKSLNSWLQDDWEPTQKKAKEREQTLHVKEKENNESGFKLQTYIDKWEKYNKGKAKEPKKASHVEMLNTLPIIGK